MDQPVFSPEYFYDEVREGFFVTEMMKRFWAAQLKILYEIVKICDKHGLVWYADMGTLLGAIRHKGYIPWDDDLDISMNREDWERFFKVAKDELPRGYCVLSVRTEEEYELSLGRITNSHAVNTNRDHMERFYGCPYVTGVDIFPIDRIYKDPEKEQERKHRAKEIRKALNSITTNGLHGELTQQILAGIERDNHLKLNQYSNLRRKLILLFEQICMECGDEDYEEVALMNTWLLDDWANCPRRIYEERIKVPFENTSLMVSKCFDEVLHIYYHDYMTVYKDGGVHNYPVYAKQEQMLKERLGHNPYRYTLRQEAVSGTRKEKTFHDKCDEIISILREALMHIEKPVIRGDTESAEELLGGCQEMAITLGNLLEGKYGEGCAPVAELESFCELLYEASGRWDKKIADNLSDSITRAEKGIEDMICEHKKEVVFLPCRAIWWDTMKLLYEKLSAEGDYDIHIVPIPWYDRDPYGGIGERHEDTEYYRGMKGFTDPTGYDIARKHPEVIVIQVPYDAYSTALTVPVEYYSEKMLKCCDELWYVPCFAPDAPVSNGDKTSKSIAVLIEQPAVVNADKVFLHDVNLKGHYIDKLAAMTGEDTREYWKQKIETV